MQPSHKHHAQPQSQPQTSTSPPPETSAAPDINIPAPNAAPPLSSQVPSTSSTEMAPRPPPAQSAAPLTMSSTQIVIAAALIVIWGVLLIFARRLVTQSLVAQFADLEKSRGAGTAFYLFLLALGATAIICSIGSFWTTLLIVAPALVLDAVLLIVFLFSLNSARNSRQRR
jgi:hypothetical protein